MEKETSGIVYQEFDGDLEGLREMAHASWFCEYGRGTWPDLYRIELMRHLFREIDDPRYLLGAYHEGKLVAFVANLPRTYRYQGKHYKCALSCMMVGHKDYRRFGVIKHLIAECLRRNAASDLDFACFYLESGHSSSKLFEKHLRPIHPIESLKKIHVLVRPVEFEVLARHERLGWFSRTALKMLGVHKPPRRPQVEGEIRLYQKRDLSAVMEMMEAIPDEKILVRTFTMEGLEHQLDSPDLTETVVFEKRGQVLGFINLAYYEIVSHLGPVKWANLDFLHWEALSPSERCALVAEAWMLAKERGCAGMMEWSKGYYNPLALYCSRFLPYPRYVGAYAWNFQPNLDFKGLEGICIQQI
ncbi:MAG: GNAT family N-acetyltransferase [Myxococcales bacterium]|nr:GNAT family N-acetyltransferase [Myxococcales bacterium]MCB9641987.1 GNAT family N-acetyltransferase [Myxococcales bacterium]